jgi:cysteine desulfurase
MWWGTKRIYLDYASSTLPLEAALAAMREAEGLIGNPGGIHAEALAARDALDAARSAIARELGCKGREIIFTSGLTESINFAILGFARNISRRNLDIHQCETLMVLAGTHWIVSSIEHAAVLESFAEVERLGGEVTHIDPNEKGIFDVETVLRALRPETVFISIGWANNEIGMLQPIRNISRALKAINDGRPTSIIFHSDAGQAPLYLSPQVHTLGVDLMSFGSNKLYGPHGVGALYVATNTALARIILGGGQERGLRSGTENVALAAGFAKSFEIIAREREAEAKRLRELRGNFAREISARIPDVVFNTDVKRSLPHMLNISIPNIQSELLALALDRAGIAVSTKSACAEGGAKTSHVVAALGGEPWRAENTLRFSLGRDTSPSDLKKAVKILTEVIKKYQVPSIKQVSKQ